MADPAFIIVPTRKVPGLDVTAGVLTLNGLSGYVSLVAGDFIEVDVDEVDRVVTVSLGNNDFAVTTGDVFTGNLSFSLSPGSGKYGLKLQSQGSDPAAPIPAGAIYFNNVDEVVRVYTSSGWQDVGPAPSAISSIQAGFGLRADGVPFGTIVSSGVLDFDLSVSPTWTGTHTFTSPITFAGSQTFNAANLSLVGQSLGMLLYRGLSAWQGLSVGSDGQVLTVSSGVPAWQTPQTPQWAKYTVSFATVAALGGTTGTVGIYLLPAGGFVHSVKIKHSTAFAGPGVSSLIASVGIGSGGSRLAASLDCATAVSNTNMLYTYGLTAFSHGSTTQLVLEVSCNTNLSNVNQGSVDVWLLTSVAV